MGTSKSDLQAAAKARKACVEYIRQNPGCTRQDVCDGMGLSPGVVRHHLHWASFYGHIKSVGHSRGARWTAAVEGAPIKAGQELGVVRTVARTKDPVELDARRREVLSYIRSHGPVTSREIAEHFDATRHVVRIDLDALKDAGCVVTTGDGGVWRWEFVQMLPRTAESVTAPVVGIKAEKRFFEPGPVVTKVEQGIKYTIQAAPNGRFHVDLLPGTGIISADNWALTQATAGGFGAAQA